MLEKTNWSPVDSADQPPLGFATRSWSGVFGIACSMPVIETGMRASWMKRSCSSKIDGVVVVEADDHAGLHLDAVRLDLADALDQVAAHVLRLLGLLQRRLPRALDADEDGGEVGGAQQLEQLVVLRDVQRDLGVEVHRVAVRLAPVGDRAQQLLGELLVADEVVVDEEDLRRAEAVALLDLGHHLLHASSRAACGRRPR